VGGEMLDNPPQDDLIARAANGDKLAVGELLLPCYEPIQLHIQALVPAKHKQLVDVNDLVQQTMVQAIRRIRRYKTLPDCSFLSWL
jgi:DNA-directed RNA polymerase specialized sigma24 family protein